jgi:hypothetical protein
MQAGLEGKGIKMAELKFDKSLFEKAEPPSAAKT